jgi:ribonuclease III
MTTDFSECEKKLAYTFKNKQLLYEALCHSSYVNELLEQQLKDNERLEFLGDAVLNLVVGHLLMEQHPQMKEGDLSRFRAMLVNESQLAAFARSMNLGWFLQLGKGETQSDGQNKQSILADTFEAVIAAVYLDGGFISAFELIQNHFRMLIENIDAQTTYSDCKSQLQELVQGSLKVVPQYSVIRESGPDHDKTFWVEVRVQDLRAEGTGKSKKAAEQEAAKNVLFVLEVGNSK